jgi:LPXTG-motif cell wall-anchored protein
MATEQALMALTAMQRMRSGGASIYDFTDYTPPAGGRTGPSAAVWAGIAAAAVCAGAGAAVLAGRRRKRHADADK